MMKTAADTRLTMMRALRLQKQNEKLSLELAQIKGELQPVAELRRDVIAANGAVKAKLLSLPARLAPALAATATAGEAHSLLHQAIYEALLDLSNPGEEPEEGEAAG
jgi:hypothetical protein